MDIAHVYLTEKKAYEGMIEFIRENIKNPMQIKECKKTVWIGEDAHYFMGENVYFRWCKGKTYIKDGEKYHSGFKMLNQ